MVPHQDEVERALGSSVCPFSGVSAEVRTRLASAMDVRDYNADDLLIRQGDEGRFLLLVVHGRGQARVRQAGGDVTSIGEIGPGSLVGEMSLVTDQARSADVVCRTPVRAAILPVDDFDAIALEHPELRTLLTEVVAERLGRSTYDSLSGKDVGGYRIVRCVGRGGMGIVYEAERLGDGEQVALKMMNHRLLYQPRAIQRFQQEAATLESLSHPAIARLYAHFTAYRTQFLVLEFCQGTTLSAILAAHGPLDEAVVRKIVGQLAGALQYVHERGVVHRDVKPSNVMLADSGRLKLLDFGLASVDSIASLFGGDDDATITPASVECLGTPRYMAPEQFGSQLVDLRADSYALACVAYEALTGRPIVESTDLFEIIRERHTFVVPPASLIGEGVSDEMHAFLVGALKPRREERIADLREVATWAGLVVLPRQGH